LIDYKRVIEPEVHDDDGDDNACDVTLTHYIGSVRNVELGCRNLDAILVKILSRFKNKYQGSPNLFFLGLK